MPFMFIACEAPVVDGPALEEDMAGVLESESKKGGARGRGRL